MAEAEPVIRAVFPDANVPISIRGSGLPVVHEHTSELGSILDSWLATYAEGIACVIGDRAFEGDVAYPVADSGDLERPGVRPGRPRRPRHVRNGHRRGCRPLRRDDPSDPATRDPHKHLTDGSTRGRRCSATGDAQILRIAPERKLPVRFHLDLLVALPLGGDSENRHPCGPTRGAVTSDLDLGPLGPTKSYETGRGPR